MTQYRSLSLWCGPLSAIALVSACVGPEEQGKSVRQSPAALYTDQLLSESDPSACFDTVGLSSDQSCPPTCMGWQNVWGVVDVAAIASGSASCCFDCGYPPNGNQNS